MGDCKGGCNTTCTTTCVGSCTGDCTSCGGACSVGCGGCTGCSGCGGCDNTCSSTCTDACNDGCTGQTMTTVYNRMVLSTIIKASEVSDLGNLIRNELTRRSKTPITTENIASSGSSVLASVVNDFYTDINSVNSSAGVSRVASNTKAEKAILQKYIDTVKTLYTTMVSK